MNRFMPPPPSFSFRSPVTHPNQTPMQTNPPILPPYQPYPVRWDTLCLFEAHGRRPKYRQKELKLLYRKLLIKYGL
jgi:hypothetical protein